MKLVIDTKVFIESISPESRFHPLFSALLNGEFSIFVSNEILLEYEEVISLRCRSETRRLFLHFLETSPFVVKIIPEYRFGLITSDPDDNKFVDYAIAANADFIVTKDRHFSVLKSIAFPKVAAITPQSYIKQYRQHPRPSN